MPTYRQLHTKIIDSFDFSEMPNDFTRVVWILLMIIVDSEGRGIYNMAWVKSRMFPLRDDVSLEQLQDAFTWLSNRKMISIYSVNGREYFYIVTFKTYQSGTQKEGKSKLPEPIINNSGASLEEVQSKSGTTAELVSAAVLYCIGSESAYDLGSVFRTYEKEIGILTPAIKDAVNDASKDYSAEWIIEAMQTAAKQNKRTFAYTLGILKSWKRDGRGNGNNGAKRKLSNDEIECYSDITGMRQWYKGETLIRTEPIPEEK
jgi:DnaD/phage-associated family protein